MSRDMQMMEVKWTIRAVRELMKLSRKEVEKIGFKFGNDLRNLNYECSTQPTYRGGYTKIEAVTDLVLEIFKDRKINKYNQIMEDRK